MLEIFANVLLLPLWCCPHIFCLVFFSGKIIEDSLEKAKVKRENLLSLSEKIMEKYGSHINNDEFHEDIKLISKNCVS